MLLVSSKAQCIQRSSYGVGPHVLEGEFLPRAVSCLDQLENFLPAETRKKPVATCHTCCTAHLLHTVHGISNRSRLGSNSGRSGVIMAGRDTDMVARSCRPPGPLNRPQQRLSKGEKIKKPKWPHVLRLFHGYSLANMSGQSSARCIPRFMRNVGP